MKISKEIFLPNLFLGECIGEPFWNWENLKFDDNVGRNVYVGEVSSKSVNFISYHCGENLETKKFGIINSNYEIVLPFEYTHIKPKNPYFDRNFIKKNTYYFYIWKKKSVGLLKIENTIIKELLPSVYKKIEQTEHINYYECVTKEYSNLYNLLEEKFLFEEGKYSKIDPTPFSSSLFNLYTQSKCKLYNYVRQQVVIEDLQDIYFVNSLTTCNHKLYELNGTKLTQYNLETFQKEELEVEKGYMTNFIISRIKACPMPNKYKNIVIENYLK